MLTPYYYKCSLAFRENLDCQDTNCQSCTHNASACEACAVPYVVAVNGVCALECGSQENLVDGRCQPASAVAHGSPGLNAGITAGIVIACVTVAVVLGLILMNTTRKKLHTIQSDLMHLLLSTQEEG